MNNNNNKVVDGVGSSKRYNKQELKTIKVAVRRKDIPEPNSPLQLQRDLDNPEDLVIHNSERGSRSSSVSSERDYTRKRKFSRERGSVSPEKKTFDSYKQHKDDERGRFGSRTLKDDIKKSERKRSRSRSPRYPQKPSVSHAVHKVESQYREHPSSCKPEYRRSRSRTRRSLSKEKREHYSKRNRSPSRREVYSPHRSETYRDPAFSEYRPRKRTPSPYKYKSADAERYRRRSRSPSRTRSVRSRSPYRSERYHNESSRRRSPSRSESHRRDYRKHSRSPSRHERYKERSRRYSRSPYHEERRYRGSPHRNRRRSPSPYKERLDRYHPIPPPHLASAPVVPLNYGPQWYPWPQPLGPRFIPPHGPIRMQRPPFTPIAPVVMGQRPRPPIIYNNRSTKITLLNKTPGTSEPTTAVNTTDSASTSTATIAGAIAMASTPSQPEGDPCESTVNSTISIESPSKSLQT